MLADVVINWVVIFWLCYALPLFPLSHLTCLPRLGLQPRTNQSGSALLGCGAQHKTAQS